MSTFVCESCDCLENTALSRYWFREEGTPALCSQCDPELGRWHGRFPRREWDGNPKGICNKDPEELESKNRIKISFFRKKEYLKLYTSNVYIMVD